jgi:hypothetical protein
MPKGMRMIDRKMQLVVCFLMLGFAVRVSAGPYTEDGVTGYVGSDFKHANPLTDLDAVLHPIFRGWASAVADYQPSDTEWSSDWDDPNRALGPASGDHFDIVSLGDMDASEISAGDDPGQITLIFGDPCDPCDPNHIRDVNGYDFAVFENGFLSGYNTSTGAVSGQMLAELAYVEVSSNGTDFVRFPSVSLTAGAVGPYGTLEVSDIFNLAGKHPNGYGVCTGTGYDLRSLVNDPLVADSTVDINNISYVRIVDVPGSGDFYDSAFEHIDPATWPDWLFFDSNNPVYDAWLTQGSGGFDLEAVGVLKDQQWCSDVNLDGLVDWIDFALFASAWGSHFGESNFMVRCDLDGSGDMVIDALDLAVFVAQWLKNENWRPVN